MWSHWYVICCAITDKCKLLSLTIEKRCLRWLPLLSDHGARGWLGEKERECVCGVRNDPGGGWRMNCGEFIPMPGSKGINPCGGGPPGPCATCIGGRVFMGGNVAIGRNWGCGIVAGDPHASLGELLGGKLGDFPESMANVSVFLQ
jgi:hypothetical protein